jgi:hypothetical protein
MPQGDGTGPLGKGPGMGRGAGFCAGSATPGFGGIAPGRRSCAGYGRSRAFGGRGRHRRFFATGLPGWMRFEANDMQSAAVSTPDAEKLFLQKRAEQLQSQIDEIKRRIEKLSSTQDHKA